MKRNDKTRDQRRKFNALVRLLFFIPRRNMRLEFDKNYGRNNRTGWTVVVDGITCSELQRWMIIALIKAYFYRWGWELECV